MALKIIYEKESCSRCGGSGSYSWCQRYGSTCFKCAGSGEQLTRRGRSAWKRIQEEKKRFHVAAADVEPGQLVDWKGVTVGGDTYTTWAKVLTAAEEDRDGRVRIELAERGKRKVAYSTAPDHMIEIRPTPEQFREVLVPLARKLKGAEVVETESA